MTTMSCVGFLFRLEANADLAMSDPTPLVTAFRAMAEDPRPTDVAANEPRLLRACGTWGEDLPATVLSEISEAVRERYDLPECESGFEAFVRLRADRPGRMLGWRYVEPTGASSGIGEDWPSSSPQWRDGPRLVADDLRELRHLGNILLNAEEDARLFLLWENSD